MGLLFSLFSFFCKRYWGDFTLLGPNVKFKIKENYVMILKKTWPVYLKEILIGQLGGNFFGERMILWKRFGIGRIDAPAAAAAEYAE